MYKQKIYLLTLKPSNQIIQHINKNQRQNFKLQELMDLSEYINFYIFKGGDSVTHKNISRILQD